MRYDDKDRQSSNVEDHRGRSRGGFRIPGFGGRSSGTRRVQIPMGGRRGGFSITTLLIIGVVMWFMGLNPLSLIFGNGGGFQLPQSGEIPRSGNQQSPFDIPGLPGGQQRSDGTQTASQNDEMKVFIGRVLADTEDVWNRVFASFSKDYREPKLNLFTGSIATACGTGQSAMGPFYCPADEEIYIDLGFFDQLKRQFQAPGDFAQAYVIAHEVGHHVQKLLGIAEQVQRAKRSASKIEGNALQVRMELQADCLAGVWANLNHQLNNRLERGDIEEGLNAASQIGDDMIQKRTRGYVVKDSFTHGSADQRRRWFTQGFESGKMQACDTFNVAYNQL
ncbi:MAG: neutral zinc metallopeptidase [Pseudomonadota bacterium]